MRVSAVVDAKVGVAGLVVMVITGVLQVMITSGLMVMGSARRVLTCHVVDVGGVID